MAKRLECRIFGRVQMVMFRDFTRRNARALGIFGFVKNLDDGSVIAIGEGEEEKLRLWLAQLKKGPILSRVCRIEEKWSEPTGQFTNFKILYSNFIWRIPIN